MNGGKKIDHQLARISIFSKQRVHTVYAAFMDV
jgi:hypothetical protein